ncbi:hypothetical protein [Streptomyces sp. SS8]
MPRFLPALLTCVFAAALAVGTAFGIVAALDGTPEQPNVPLVSFPEEAASPSPPASPSPGAGERD